MTLPPVAIPARVEAKVAQLVQNGRLAECAAARRRRELQDGVHVRLR